MTDHERLNEFTTLIGKPPRKTKFNEQGHLVELDLAGLELTALPPQIGQFQHLTHLYLGYVFDDDGTTYLGLGNPLATLPAEVGQLLKLQRLDLSRTQLISLPDEVWQLPQLRVLNLFGTQLTNLPAKVRRLLKLQQLDLRNTKLTSLPVEVGQLLKLQRLDLSYTELTSLPAEIGQLLQLQQLDLTGTKLTNLPAEIGQLLQLKQLDLTATSLTSLPAEVWQLQQLQQLHLSGRMRTSLPAEVGQLQQLQRLNLSGTRLASLPAEVWQLQRLQQLSLRYTQLTSLPAEVGQLQRLQRLDLSRTPLTVLPAEVGQLQRLQRLDLSRTPLTVLPAEVGQLQRLQQLDLSRTRLTSVPAEVGQLQQLQELWLSHTQLTSLPAEIRELRKLRWLDLRETKLRLPPEILEKIGEPQTILDYYFQALKPLNEAKLLLVGQGGVGKTSLVKRLTEGGFSPEEAKTEGINIQPWQMQVNGQQIRLNIWDFGGQEIMHATHQFFLTHRSLYLLVLDARQGEQEGRLEYWLKLIQSFGGDSPVIVVLNKCDQHHLALDERGLKYKYYPNLKAFVETSCQSGVGIPELTEQIRQELAQMAHVRDLMPPTWFAVKSDLEAMQADYLAYHKYQSICQTHTINVEENQSRLIRLLHDLGIALNYPDARLQDTNVLKPEWVTNGIYQIINSPQLANCDGMLEREQLDSILDPQRYPASKQLFIIDMMRKFELCFDVEGKRDEQFLIPDLLPKEQPDFTWQHEANLAFEYHYDILPGSILSRFIVRMHTYVLPQKAWRSGVILADGNNQALIIADREEGKIYISVGGQEQSRRAFLTAIRLQFDHIRRTITGIKAKQMIPLSGYPNQAIAYQDLLTYEKANELTPLWPKVNARLNVKQLLDGVGRPEQEQPSPDKPRRHRADEFESQEAWRENRWLREEKARKRKRYEDLALTRVSVVNDAEGKAKRLTAIYLLCYISFCMICILILFAIPDLLSDEWFNRLGEPINFAIATIIWPAAAWAASHYLNLESLWPSNVLRQLQEGEFKRLCNERHFPEAEYQTLAREFGDSTDRLR